MGIPEKIEEIKKELENTKVNKATEHHVGLLKAKLSKLRAEQEEQRGKSQGAAEGFDVRRAGDATVVLIGLPSVGKSTLLNRLTGSKSEVGNFQFTTLTVVPGMLDYKGAKIQILDLPGIIKDASLGKGLGKRVLSVARNADLILLVLDVFQPYLENVLRTELSNIGIKLDQKRPNIVIEKTHHGGIFINEQVKMTKLNPNLLKDILRVYGINNARVLVREDIDSDQLIDFVSANRSYIQSLVVMNKIDLVNQGFVSELQNEMNSKFVPISADADVNINHLKEVIYENLDFIRIFMRPKGGVTDFEEPLIIRRGATVSDVCNKIHRDLRREFRYAVVWGESVKFDGQRVGLNHTLYDKDVLTLVKRK